MHRYIADTLRKAKALITNPRNWNKGSYSSTGYDDYQQWETYCAIGALQKVDGDWQEYATNTLLYACQSAYKWSDGVESWNDQNERTHQEVLSLFDLAIEIEEHLSDLEDAGDEIVERERELVDA